MVQGWTVLCCRGIYQPSILVVFVPSRLIAGSIEKTMTRREQLEQDIVGLLDGADPRSLEDLIGELSAYRWNEILSAVDRLSRESKLVLLQSRPSQYLVALHPVEHLSRHASAA